ncbi:hypothetical protein YPPY66_3893, partial [Yersinia pestis PY-66]
MTTNLLTLCY